MRRLLEKLIAAVKPIKVTRARDAARAAEQEDLQKSRQKLFDKILKALIEENYEQRRLGLLPDEWFWADFIATSWGFHVDPMETMSEPEPTYPHLVMEPIYGEKESISPRDFLHQCTRND